MNFLGIKIKSGLHRRVRSLEKKIKIYQNILEFCIDITKIPKAKGVLRDLQLADILALNIFDKICNKYKLDYWLDYGTLLGKIRHGGFIPWDDDIDIGMPRSDYEKIRDSIYKEFEKISFRVSYGKGYFQQIIRLSYKNSPVQIDLWPYDLYYKAANAEEKISLEDNIKKCHEQFYKKYTTNFLVKNNMDFPIENLIAMQKKIILKGKSAKKNSAIFTGSEAYGYSTPRAYDYETIYPLKKSTFENIVVYIPNDCDTYLSKIYGNYMGFPNIKHAKTTHYNIKDNLQNLSETIQELEVIHSKII